MKRFLQVFAVILVIVLASVCIIACNDETDYTEIETNDLAFENGHFKMSVAHDVESYDLISKFSVSENAWFVIGKDEGFAQILPNDIVSLVDGNNYFYVKIMDGKHETVYKFNIYRKKMCTVQFQTNGGSSVPDITIEEGNTIESPNSMKLGYNLSWDFDFSKPITGNTTINAKWTPCEYGIIISAEGTQMHQQRVDVTFGNSFDIEPPVKDGYEFKGWLYNNSDFDTSEPYKYPNDITIVADFQATEYTISYIIDQDVVNPNASIVTFTIESDITLQDAVWGKNDEKRFAGWYTTNTYEENSKISEISNRTGALKLYAKFEDVVFKSMVSLYVDGALVDSFELTYKSPYSISYNPTVDEFHKFEGWKYNLEVEPVVVEAVGSSWPYKTEVRLDADISSREYDIEYILFGGTNNPVNPNTFSVDRDIDLASPTYGNHEFLGWYTTSSFEEASNIKSITSDMAGKPITLYAKWLFKSQVTFDADGGTCDIENDLFTNGAEYVLPTPTKDKYNFGGWYLNGEKIEQKGVWIYSDDKMLVAYWIPVPYAINYILNGGIKNESNPTGYDVTSGMITLLDPSWENGIKSFGGWYLESTFETKIEEIDSNAYEGITLYARWNEIKVTINYDADGGQISSTTSTVVLGSNYSLLEPQRPGYSFEGWFNGETPVELSGVWTSNVESVDLVAKWNIIKYNVDYNLNGGSAEGLVSGYNILSGDIVLPTPTMEGYTFIGWYTNGGGISQNVTIPSGSFGDKSYEAKWFKTKDDNGFVYELRNGTMVVVDFDKTLPDYINTSVDSVDIYVPEYYYGYKVTSIGNRAFAKFGSIFAVSSYLDENGNINYYRDGNSKSGGFTKIYLPTSIEHIGAYAFEGCIGIKIQLYSPSGEYANYITWDAGVTFEVGNIPARDCIWGFRPAIGWSRYSLANIPEGYDK